MKTLIKVLLPLTLASTLIVGCGENKEKCGDKDCGDKEVCVKTSTDANAKPICAKKCTTATQEQDCGTGKTCADSKDSTPVKYCPAS